ncbi:hypothetical protein [Arthrobacter sp. Marseille-P9274]|uniref:hypothetical protein n=1 Tax=Arthrobacter sp. Marseille-P9274 TaxID=2866572 RepID=UPI0021C65CD3|nr:hypothetical protein [Arthrobacter sp. Marseille-P9274]
MTDAFGISYAAGESKALSLARLIVADTLAELERVWSDPRPEAVVAAARRHLAAAEDWANVRREGA